MRKKKAESEKITVTVRFKDNERPAVVDKALRTLKITMDSDSATDYGGGKWNLPKNLVDFLYKNKLTLIVTDRKTKWQLSISAEDVVYHAQLVNDIYNVPKDSFVVLKAKTTTMLLKCKTPECLYNYYGMCLQGTIELERGKCKYYG